MGSFSSRSPCSSLAGLGAEDPPDLGVAPSLGPPGLLSLPSWGGGPVIAFWGSCSSWPPGSSLLGGQDRDRLLGLLLLLASLLFPLGGAGRGVPPGSPAPLSLLALPSWGGGPGIASWGSYSSWPPCSSFLDERAVERLLGLLLFLLGGADRVSPPGTHAPLVLLALPSWGGGPGIASWGSYSSWPPCSSLLDERAGDRLLGLLLLLEERAVELLLKRLLAMKRLLGLLFHPLG